MLPKCLSWKNVALSVHTEVVPYSAEVVKMSSLPQSVDFHPVFGNLYATIGSLKEESEN